MTEPLEGGEPISLRQIVREATGYDVRRCGRCSYCVHFVTPEDDLSLEMLMQLVMQDDDDVLTARPHGRHGRGFRQVHGRRLEDVLGAGLAHSGRAVGARPDAGDIVVEVMGIGLARPKTAVEGRHDP